jgi:hypothetical protein
MKICVGMLLTAFFLMPASAVVMAADPQQDQDACMMDAQTICGQFIPDRERVAQCLMANRSRITPACREALKHFK